MKLYGMVVTGLSVAALVVGAAPMAMAQPPATPTPAQPTAATPTPVTPKPATPTPVAPKPAAAASLHVSPVKAKPGSAVRVTATCAGKSAKLGSGALVGLKQVANVNQAPHTVWSASVGRNVKPGGYAVGFECNGKVHKTYLTVVGATPAVKKTPKKAVRTGGGGTAGIDVDDGHGAPAAAEAWPRMATTYLVGPHR